MKVHPIKYYYRQGIRVTINTDNRLISNTTLTKEFLLAHQLFGFNLNNFKEITINAIKSSFINHKKRIALIKSVLREFEKELFLMHDPDTTEADRIQKIMDVKLFIYKL